MPVKGDTLSIESIEKMKESKKQNLSSKYNWVYAEPYFDVEIKKAKAAAEILGEEKGNSRLLDLSTFIENRFGSLLNERVR